MKAVCPTCRRSFDPSGSREWRPFCSARCRLIDLGAWASEEYRVCDTPEDARTWPDENLPDENLPQPGR